MATAEPRRPVLVVEDDDDIRAAIAEILEGEGYEVAVAADGLEGLEVLGTLARPGLILLDLLMPKMDGQAFLERLAQLPPLRGVPVLILTAVSDKIPAGASGLLRKPFTTEELLDAVRQIETQAA